MSFSVGGVIAGGVTTGLAGAAGVRASAGGSTGSAKSGDFTTGGAIVGTVTGGDPDLVETGCGVGIVSTGGSVVDAGEVVFGLEGVADAGIVADGIPAAG